MCFDKGAVVGNVSGCCAEDDDDEDEEEEEDEEDDEEDAGGAVGAAEEDEEDEEDEDIVIGGAARAPRGRGAERFGEEWAFLLGATRGTRAARRSQNVKRAPSSVGGS